MDEAVALAGIRGLADRTLSSLSGGERQKVMIAAAIAQETGIILMDEPTTYLDYAHQAEIMDVMAGVNRERGVAMIVVTHDVNLAMSLAGHVVALSRGRVIWAGPPSGLFEPGRLEAIYGTRFRVYSPGSMRESVVLLPERGGGLACTAEK
jgi:iron complex transport system ATP-binding protein